MSKRSAIVVGGMLPAAAAPEERKVDRHTVEVGLLGLLTAVGVGAVALRRRS